MKLYRDVLERPQGLSEKRNPRILFMWWKERWGYAKNTWGMGKKKKKELSSPHRFHKDWAKWIRRLRRRPGSPQWQLPHGFLDGGWEMAVALGATQNVFHLTPSLSVGSVRAKPEEVVSFGEPLVTVLSSGGAGRLEGRHQAPRALPPVWLERSLLDS